MTGKDPKNVHQSNDKVGIGLIISAVVIVVILLFIIQNRDPVPFEFLFIDITMPAWLFAIVFVALGIVLGWVWRWMSRRRAKS
ncbi:MAG: LapA family protein [Actinomycetota bacterium]